MASTSTNQWAISRANPETVSAQSEQPTYGTDMGMNSSQNKPQFGGGQRGTNMLRSGAQRGNSSGMTGSNPGGSGLEGNTSTQQGQSNNNVRLASQQPGQNQGGGGQQDMYGRRAYTQPQNQQYAYSQTQQQNTNPYYQQYQQQQAPPPTQSTYTPYTGRELGQVPGLTSEQYAGRGNEQRNSFREYADQQLQWEQYRQNADQYRSDFNEAARRFDEQQGWGRYTDQANIGLQMRDRDLAARQTDIGAQQWQQQFGETQRDNRFTQELARDQFDLGANQQQWNQGFQDRQLGQQGDLTREGYANQQELAAANNLAQWQRQQAQLGEQGRQADQQYDLGRGRLESDTGRWQGQQGIDAFAARSTADYQQGQLANTGLYQQGQLANQGRGLDIQDYQTRQEVDYRNRQLMQQAALQREQMALQREAATMQAYGRAQRPQARFIRNYG